MMKLYVATHNTHKIREISQIVPDLEIIADDPVDIEENAPDFAGNALIKVRAIAARHPGEWCMADDSGLEVKALHGLPGVKSARYAGEPTNTSANNALLLKNLDGVTDRRARFTCCCALIDPSGEELTVHGHCLGQIALAPSGSEGFGYDPLFIPDGYDKSFADLTADEKNAISHRGRALKKVRELIGTVEPFRAGGVNPWLRLLRAVNIPTVPGDVLVGAALWPCFAGCDWVPGRTIAAAGASIFIYLFGLVDNDIVGMRTDQSRPLPDGEISLNAARLVRFLLLAAVCGLALGFDLMGLWRPVALVLLGTVLLYNRTKWSFLMGACRALNVVCGVVAANEITHASVAALQGPVAVAAAIWFVYIWAVTRYSEGEDSDPAKKRRVGQFIGGIVYLQLLALMYLALRAECNMPLLLAGALLLAALRGLKMLWPKVEAS